MFLTERQFPVNIGDVSQVAGIVGHHFHRRGHHVTTRSDATGGWHLSMTKGGNVAAVFGARTHLTIDLQPRPNGLYVRAAAPAVTPQLIPLAVGAVLMVFTACLWLPVLAVGIVGIIRQSRLDDEAVAVIESTLQRPGHPIDRTPPAIMPIAPPRPPQPAPRQDGQRSCAHCGQQLPDSARFCVHCGTTTA